MFGLPLSAKLRSLFFPRCATSFSHFFSYGGKSHSLHIYALLALPPPAQSTPPCPPICHIQMSPRWAAPPLPFLAFALLSSHQLRKKKRKQLKFSSSTFAVQRGEGGGGGVSAAAYHVGEAPNLSRKFSTLIQQKYLSPFTRSKIQYPHKLEFPSPSINKKILHPHCVEKGREIVRVTKYELHNRWLYYTMLLYAIKVKLKNTMAFYNILFFYFLKLLYEIK